MTVSFVDNVSARMVDVLREGIARATEARLSAAYVSARGVELVRDALLDCCSKGGPVEFIVGVDSFATEPAALRELLKLRERTQKVTCICHGDPLSPRGGIYHPKCYILQGAECTDVIVGSSNLTEGGLCQNTELNVVVSFSNEDEVLEEVNGVYDHFKFGADCFVPDEEFLEAYAEAAKRVSGARRLDVDALAAEGLAQVLSAKRSALRLASPSASELRGWQRLVYEKLPEEPFRSHDLYRYEPEFARAYPKNRYIPDKIRQTLQRLRDIGLLRLWEDGSWQKTHPGRDQGGVSHEG
jgi:HKD family nuclease